MPKPVTLTLLARAYCHLCDEMHAAVEPIARRFGAQVAVVDVDSDAGLADRYGELVPVLLLGSAHAGVPLCHYTLDAEAVLRAFESQ